MNQPTETKLSIYKKLTISLLTLRANPDLYCEEIEDMFTDVLTMYWFLLTDEEQAEVRTHDFKKDIK